MVETPTFQLNPLVEHWVWQCKAACRGMDVTVFFHPPGERGEPRGKRIAAAKQVCNRCPVLNQCLEHALEVREPYGIWGGRSEEERAALAGARPRQIPEKSSFDAPWNQLDQPTAAMSAAAR
jgi:WhiB family redox-sensing transcriptional regulator